MGGLSVPLSLFPNLEQVTILWRSLVNDTFPGLNGAQGRIATDAAPFTLPFFNSAYRTLLRKLRNEGVTFPIVDGFVIPALPAVVAPNPSIFVSIGYGGYNNGTQNYGSLKLPGDLLQPLVVRQRTSGSNLEFTPMKQSQEGLASGYQNQWLGEWEWRDYAIWMNGSLQVQDIMIRYKAGNPAINPAVQDFANTPIPVIDCTDALAFLMAADYGAARGANPDLIQRMEAKAADAIDDMALEYVRRQQTVTYSRISYQGGGSNNTGNTSLGSTGATS